MFYHSITKFVFIFKSLSDSSPEATRHFFTESVVTTTHEQNIICSKSHLDSTTHEQTIICRQLFAGHVVGSRPMKRKKKMHRMIISFILFADDTNLFYSHKNADVLIKTMNQELRKITSWLSVHKLSLNVKKTHFMIFKTKRKKTKSNIVN